MDCSARVMVIIISLEDNRRLGVFRNGVLRRMPDEQQEVKVEQRKLHDCELHSLKSHFSPNIIILIT